MALDWRESEPMILPCCQVFGAVHSHTATLGMAFDFVLSKKPKCLGQIMIVDSASMGVYKVPVGVVPQGSRHNVGRRPECCKQWKANETAHVV